MKVPVHIVHSNHVILCNLGVKDLNICFNVFGIGRLGDNSWGKKMTKFYQGKQIYQWECKCHVWSVYKTKTYMYMMYSVKHSFCKKTTLPNLQNNTLGDRGFPREESRSGISEAQSGEERENRQEARKPLVARDS